MKLSSQRGSRVCCFASVILAAALPHRRAAAQTDPRLVAAVRLAQDGLSDSARAVAGRILAALPPTDSLYPEALYTVGLLAATERNRRLELRRVVVEYAQSVWADDALLQLAQLDYVSGNPAATVLEIDQLLRDYPESPLTAVAAFWGARAASDRREADPACRLAERGLAAVRNDVELRNQLEFQKQRCQGLTAMVAADSARMAAADSVAKAKADSLARATKAAGRRAPASGFYVQVSAVATQAAADSEIARVKRAGFSSVVLRERGYLKIRAGRFATRVEAEAALAQLRTRLGGQPFVVRVPPP
jgi:hypothetical protein